MRRSDRCDELERKSGNWFSYTMARIGSSKTMNKTVSTSAKAVPQVRHSYVSAQGLGATNGKHDC